MYLGFTYMIFLHFPSIPNHTPSSSEHVTLWHSVLGHGTIFTSMPSVKPSDIKRLLEFTRKEEPEIKDGARILKPPSSVGMLGYSSITFVIILGYLTFEPFFSTFPFDDYPSSAPDVFAMFLAFFLFFVFGFVHTVLYYHNYRVHVTDSTIRIQSLLRKITEIRFSDIKEVRFDQNPYKEKNIVFRIKEAKDAKMSSNLNGFNFLRKKLEEKDIPTSKFSSAILKKKRRYI